MSTQPSLSKAFHNLDGPHAATHSIAVSQNLIGIFRVGFVEWEYPWLFYVQPAFKGIQDSGRKASQLNAIRSLATIDIDCLGQLT